MATSNKINFEKSLHELESIVDKMEHGELELEQSLKMFEKGVKLIRNCQTSLKQAEQRVQILTEKSGKLELEPYETEDTE